MLHDLPVLAQDAGQPPSSVPMLVMFAVLIGILYFLIWRPQRQRERERQEMLARVKKNDHVVTTGGIHGIVTSVKDDEVTLKVDEANNVRIRFSRSAIGAIVAEGAGTLGTPPGEKPGEAPADKKKA